MAIRRRRKKLTSLVSRLDERVRSVELRPVSLLTSDQVDAAVEIGETLLTPTNVVSSSAPNQFFKIEDAYYYSKELTGNAEDRVSIYLESDLQLPVGDNIEISGIHGTNTNDVDVSGVFEVKFVDSEPWTDRASWKHDPTQDQLPGVTITNEYSIKPDTLGPSTWGDTYRRLQTKRLVDTFSITDSTVTLTMNAVHKFKVDDVVYVDIFAEDSRAFGADGLFKITAVTSNTIEYELTAGVDTPTGDITPSADFYVYPVARNHLPVGSTWSDSSTNKIYVWDGIRWVDYSAVDIQGDDDPPNAPTNLQITSELKFFQTTVPVVEVTAEWDPPVTSESGDPLTDLLGYTIKYRSSSAEPWEVRDLPFTDTSYTFKAAADFQPGTTYSFEVYAYDSGNLYSEALTGSHTTESAPSTNIALVRPASFDSKIYLGTVTLTWDGTVEDTSGNPQTKPDGLVFLDIHASTTDNFTPSTSTLITTISAVAGNKYVYADVEYGTTYYFKGVLRDASGTSSLPSTQISAVTQSLVDASRISGIIAAANITPGTMVTGEKIVGLSITGELIEALEINADLIEANTINADHIDAASISAALVESDSFRTASTGARVEFNSSGIYGYNSSNSPTFRVIASTGEVFISEGVQIGGYPDNDDLDAVNTTATNAQSTADNAVTIANGKITIGGAAADVNDNKLFTTIDGDGITANTITATQINSDYVYAGTIDADQINAGLLTAFRIQTSSGGKRILLSESSNRIVLYDSNGTTSGFIEGNTAGLQLSNGVNDLFLSLFSNSMVVESSGGFQYIDVDQNLGKTIIQGARFPLISGGGIKAVYADDDGDLQLPPSDRRIKKNISEANLGLSFINRLNSVNFNFNNEESSATKDIGLIAQDVLEALNAEQYQNPSKIVFEYEPSDKQAGILSEPADKIYGINYDRMVIPLIKSIQELSQKNEELQTRLEALEGN